MATLEINLDGSELAREIGELLQDIEDIKKNAATSIERIILDAKASLDAKYKRLSEIGDEGERRAFEYQKRLHELSMLQADGSDIAREV
ncbi:MAG: hypothetical protein HQL74_07350 [Magnetococcales bacterium]|nr:hypothetical protein [Magnetococcales bacterium]